MDGRITLAKGTSMEPCAHHIFSPECLAEMAAAYRAILHRLECSNPSQNVKEVIAGKVVAFAKKGVTDSERLCALALDNLGLDGRRAGRDWAAKLIFLH